MIQTSDAWPWFSSKAALILAGVGNAVAWGQSIATNNVNAGAIAFFCTATVPIIGGAIIYLTRNVWPVVRDAYFDYCERRDKLQSGTLAGQMAGLTASLAEERRGRDAVAQLAEIQSRRVEALTAMVKDLTVKVDEANSGIIHANERAEDANRKLHKMSGEAQKALSRSELDKLELQAKLDKANAELQHANQQLGDLAAKVDESIVGTSKKASQNSDRLDQIEKAVSGDSLLGPGSTDDYLPTVPRS